MKKLISIVFIFIALDYSAEELVRLGTVDDPYQLGCEMYLSDSNLMEQQQFVTERVL